MFLYKIPNCKLNMRGFTLLEVMIAIGITTIMSGLILISFSDFRARQTLNASVETVLAAFSQAHLDTISSRNDYAYGIYLKSNEVIYFRGTTYPGDADANNIHYVLPIPIEIANISLNGGGSAIFYKRLSGATDNYGTFEVRVKSKADTKTTVTLNQTGALSI